MKDISKIKKIINSVLKNIFKLFLIFLIIYNISCILELEDLIEKTGYDIIVIEKYQQQKGINKNTLIIAKTKNKKYNIDDLVVIRVSNSEYIHRIVGCDERGRFITKGDNNYREDEISLKTDEITGKVIFKNYFLGLIFRFAQTGIFSALVCVYIIIYFTYSKHIYNKKLKRRQKQKTNPQNSIK